MNRPLPIAALLYASGVLLAGFWPFSLTVLFAITFPLALGALLLSRGRTVCLALALLAFGAVNCSVRTAVLSPVDLRLVTEGEPMITTVRGTLAGMPEQRVYARDEKPSWRTMAEVRVAAIQRGTEWQSALGRVTILTPGVLDEAFVSGAEVEITGVLQRPDRARADGLFDYQEYLEGVGIYRVLKTGGTNDWKLNETHLARAPLSYVFNVWAKATLAKGLPEEDEPLRLLWAMTLGWKTALTQEVAEPFMRSGTLHVFAISGLHVALIAGILVALLRVLQVPRHVCGWLIIPLLWAYTAVTGWQPSAIRSTVMMTIVIGGWALRRPSDLLNSLAAAALILLIWDPLQLFQAGFQLSFLVVLGLALMNPVFEKVRQSALQGDPLLPEELWPRGKRWGYAAARVLAANVSTSLAAWLGSLPLIAYYFHLVTPVSLLANLLIVPLSGLALASSLGSLLCGDVLPWLTILFNHSAWLWMKWMIDLSEWMARWPGAFFFVRAPGFFFFVIYYGSLAGFLSGWFIRRERWKWALPAAFLGAVVSWPGMLPRGNDVRVHVLPLAGSGLWIDGPGHENDLLIDCADASGADLLLKPFLRAQGINRIPHLLLSHGDVQHLEGFEPLQRDFALMQISTPAIPFRSPLYREILTQLAATPSRWRPVSRGDMLAGWKVIHPALEDRPARADDGAVVLLGEFHGTRVLLLSDLGPTGQRTLLRRETDLRADIVIAGIPGQGEPLGSALMEAVQPRLIILATAEYPARARASRELLQRLAAAEVPIVLTDRTGAATLTLQPAGWKVRTMEGLEYSSRSLPPFRARAENFERP